MKLEHVLNTLQQSFTILMTWTILMLLETFRRDSVVEIDEQNTNTTIVIYLGRKKV